ncbi:MULTISPECIES: response regulator transcription factor [unclassified Modestobacter]|uniref:response regulator transcription factor n=1 Tax=unclassified Modestobacter TaxID=2643866 RepID=UPI0022AAD93D|nr:MULTISPECIES: response regulator transcription factor [unclassified Modestobacter]MCZ2810164.1 response regulator transcription factor [Modestobacter sp. VKM Ac-2979]MCZ2841650.1 response regulator transcription factor [Modestobacter sp. VKM Ac-2980]MCZ2850247.1 response regulator transcription factor [Modestobacter sp. VKM Ac-2978]
MTVRVLLVDDEELVRSGLRTILEAQADIEVVGEVADGAVVVPAVARSCPDVVVLDIRMPLVDGIEATRTLRRRHPTAPRVLVLTTFADDENVYAALHAGADGFLPKRARPAEIVDAVRVVARGESLLFPAAIRSLAVRHAGGGTARGAARVALTDREADVLRLMAHGLSNGEIATELFLGLQTVKTHVSSLLRKLGARDRTQAVIAAYESGLVPLR